MRTVVVQDALTGEIRMVAHATEEALTATRTTGNATFFSRSRGELWEKGKTSGNTIRVRRVLVDCDEDALVYEGDPDGPSCHTGAGSCFFRVLGAEAGPAPTQTLLLRLEAELEARKSAGAEKSYTRSLYDGGPARIGAKIREEADEVARAIEGEDDGRVAAEAADLLYHVMVGLRARGVPVRDVLAVLDARMGTSGHEEKARRPAVVST